MSAATISTINIGDVSLPRRLTAEALGTAILLATVVGSGIMGEQLEAEEHDATRLDLERRIAPAIAASRQRAFGYGNTSVTSVGSI